MFHEIGNTIRKIVSQLSTETHGLGYCVTQWDGVQ